LVDRMMNDQSDLVQHIASLSHEVKSLIEQKCWPELILLDKELLALIKEVVEGAAEQPLQTEQLDSLHDCLGVLLAGIDRVKAERSCVSQQFSNSKQKRSALVAYDICKK